MPIRDDKELSQQRRNKEEFICISIMSVENLLPAPAKIYKI